ncbi:Holliday junction branch migration DNA helicase RuvB [Candidatus Mycoplasma haematohominis]|uniref:Holliday junction branch migration DNA helicase RuvB n=1 Tax=Candidatus Mycoplasma haematohominis TaxID=1494318 RepID=UPI001C0A6C7B|nr:Holliday junction branch migration DNA helicase RuvB [Candidatus Mycoplasma haemohominis]
MKINPQNLSQFIGKEKIIKALKIGIKAAVNSEKSLDHILLYGPPGVGKTSLAHAISYELKSQIKIIQGANINHISDLMGVISSLKKGDVLFIDEIHAINNKIAEILYPVLEHKIIDLIVGKNLNKRTIRIPHPNFTVVAATTNLGDITKALEERFGYVFYLDEYTPKELTLIVKSIAKKMELTLQKEDIREIVDSSRGIPRNTVRILKRVKDYSLAYEKAPIKEIIKECGFLYKGLNSVDIKYLNSLKENCCSLTSISYRINVDEKTIVNKIEPYLYSNSWISKNNKGRYLTEEGKELLKELMNQFG